MSETDKTFRPNGRLFVVSGPSGSGKTTLCKQAVQRVDAKLSVSATTRSQGKNEVDGVDYFFLSEPEFLRRVEEGVFLEHARVFDHYYGTPRPAVMEQLEAGQDVILEIDVQGAAKVFAAFDQAVGILVLPPSDDELRRRLTGRGRDAPEVIEKRLSKAREEIAQARAEPHYRHTIVNDRLDAAIDELVRIVGRASEPTNWVT